MLASGLGLVRVLKSVYGSQLAQPRCHLGFTHATVYGQATTSYLNIVDYTRQMTVSPHTKHRFPQLEPTCIHVNPHSNVLTALPSNSSASRPGAAQVCWTRVRRRRRLCNRWLRSINSTALSRLSWLLIGMKILNRSHKIAH